MFLINCTWKFEKQRYYWWGGNSWAKSRKVPGHCCFCPGIIPFLKKIPGHLNLIVCPGTIVKIWEIPGQNFFNDFQYINENLVIQNKLLKLIQKLGIWRHPLLRTDYYLESRQYNFIDSTSNRLEHRNIIIKEKIQKYPGKRPIDIICCLRSYFLL